MTKVLLLDDHVDAMGEAIKSIKNSGIDCLPLKSIGELKEFLDKNESFDGVILDWFLDEQPDSNHARGCLNLIKECRFVPVFIYTEHQENYKGEAESVEFPKSCISSFSKAEVCEFDLGLRIKEWLEGFFAGKISESWRKANRRAIEKVLYELASMDNAGVTASLKLMTQAENGETCDVDHALDLLQRISGRALFSDKELRDDLETCLKAEVSPKTATEIKIWQYHMYYHPSDNIVMAGDFVFVKRDDLCGKDLFVVLTPACDLAQFKTTHLRIVRVINIEGSGGNLPLHLYPLQCYPAGVESATPLAIDFHQTYAVLNETIEQQWRTLQEKGQKKLPSINMTYAHAYRDMSGQKIFLKRIARLDDPYRSDLFQRFSSHASRIGVPDVST